LGLDLVNNPELLEQPSNGAVSSGWFWDTRNLNAKADLDQLTLISVAINGRNKLTGLPNGIEDRLFLLGTAKRAIRAAGFTI
jgi:putative chitinase